MEAFLQWCRERIQDMSESIDSANSREIRFGDGRIETSDEWKTDLKRRRSILRSLTGDDE